MKIDRLIGILSVLLQEEKTTAPELAERFEVSKRTINRDIEDLCRAGIPIRTTQGSGGGISIMDGYRMDRTILTSKDMQMILVGLRSLDSVSGSSYYGQLMEKIQAGSSAFVSGRDSILIDLSSWYRESLAPRMPSATGICLNFAIMLQQVKVSGWLSHIIWCFDGPAGICGAGAETGRI